jgi:hypothetical protein
MILIKYFLFVFMACFLCIFSSYAAPRQSAILKPSIAVLYDDLSQRLREGGYTLYFVPPGLNGEDKVDIPEWWKQCPFSTMLSVDGINRAKVIRRSFDQIGLQIGLVRSSQHCAAMSTATFLSNNPSKNIYPVLDLNLASIQKQYEGVNDAVIKVRHHSNFMLGTWLGTNTLVVGHPLTLANAPHPVMADLNEGDSAIFKLGEDGELTLYAKLNWQQWQEMGNYVQRKGMRR